METVSYTHLDVYKRQVYLTPGTYTFSAYLYLNNVQSVSTGGGAFLELDGEKSRVYTGTSNAAIQGGWQRVYVTKTISTAGNYKMCIRDRSSTATVRSRTSVSTPTRTIPAGSMFRCSSCLLYTSRCV